MVCLSLLAAATLTTPVLAEEPVGTWEKREVNGMQLETPFALSKSIDLAGNLPPEAKEKIDAMTSAMGGGEDNFIVSVVTSTYKTGVTVSLDGAVKGMVNGMAGKIGDTNPQFINNTIKVSGLDARKGTYQKSLPDGRLLRLEFLMVARGQTIWSVQVFTLNDKTAGDMARVLGSVALQPAP